MFDGFTEFVKIIKASENKIGSRSGVFSVNFEHTQRSIQYLSLLFLSQTLSRYVSAGI